MLVEQGYESAKLAGLSILGNLKRELGSLEKVAVWLQVSNDKYGGRIY